MQPAPRIIGPLTDSANESPYDQFNPSLFLRREWPEVPFGWFSCLMFVAAFRRQPREGIQNPRANAIPVCSFLAWTGTPRVALRAPLQKSKAVVCHGGERLCLLPEPLITQKHLLNILGRFKVRGRMREFRLGYNENCVQGGTHYTFGSEENCPAFFWGRPVDYLGSLVLKSESIVSLYISTDFPVSDEGLKKGTCFLASREMPFHFEYRGPVAHLKSEVLCLYFQRLRSLVGCRIRGQDQVVNTLDIGVPQDCSFFQENLASDCPELTLDIRSGPAPARRVLNENATIAWPIFKGILRKRTPPLVAEEVSCMVTLKEPSTRIDLSPKSEIWKCE